MNYTENLLLELHNTTTDKSLPVITWRSSINGEVDSAFIKIDKAFGELKEQMTKISGSAIKVEATGDGLGNYSATGIDKIEEYKKDDVIALIPSVDCTGNSMLNINSLGSKSLMKVANDGTLVILENGDLRANHEYYFRYNGSVFVWQIGTSAEQLNYIPKDGLTSTNVQDAINELIDILNSKVIEKVSIDSGVDLNTLIDVNKEYIAKTTAVAQACTNIPKSDITSFSLRIIESIWENNTVYCTQVLITYSGEMWIRGLVSGVWEEWEQCATIKDINTHNTSSTAHDDIRQLIGDVDNLTTISKEVVGAINEINSKALIEKVHIDSGLDLNTLTDVTKEYITTNDAVARTCTNIPKSNIESFNLRVIENLWGRNTTDCMQLLTTHAGDIWTRGLLNGAFGEWERHLKFSEKGTFKNIEDLGLSDADFNPLDIGENLYKIFNAMPNRSVIISSFTYSTPNMYSSLKNKLTQDLGVDFIQDIYICVHFTKLDNIGHPCLVDIYLNGGMKRYSFIFDRDTNQTTVNNVSKMYCTIGEQTSNPNLLINGDFRNPVNQRNVSVVNTSICYTIDRWRLSIADTSNSFEVKNGYVTLNCNVADNTYLTQSFEDSFIKTILNKPLTLSIRYRSNMGFRCIPFGDLSPSSDMWVEKSLTISSFTSDHIIIQNYYNNSYTSGYIDIEWIKVELGECATPFVPRSYGEELALCQRYCYVMYWSLSGWMHGFGEAKSSTGGWVFFPLPTTMRCLPTLAGGATVNSNWMLNTSKGKFSPDSIKVRTIGSGGIVLDFTSSTALTTGEPVTMYYNSGDIGIFDAEIY